MSKSPTALPSPPTPPPTPEQLASQVHQRQLRISYGNFFGSIHGKTVLEDLKKRFGWDGDIERPSYRPGMTFDQTANADGMKEPIRHILAMQQIPDEEQKPKPTTATS